MRTPENGEPSPRDESDSTDFYTNSPPRTRRDDPPTDLADGTPLKRKLHDAQAPASDKRQKTQSPVFRPVEIPRTISRLPSEVWQHVFTFLPPETLAFLLRTCRVFREYLTSPNLTGRPSKAVHGLQNVHPDEVWRASRIRSNASMPVYPPGCSERELLKLLKCKNCQFCGKMPTYRKRSKSWLSGPGEDDVCCIWPFLVRSCGHCLVQRVKTDHDLMLSDYSALLSVAPFAFLTQDKNVLSPFAFRLAGEIPRNVHVSKVYFLPQLEVLQSNFQLAKENTTLDAVTFRTRMSSKLQKIAEIKELWEKWDLEGIDNGISLQRGPVDSVEDEPRVKVEDLEESISDLPLAQPTTASHSRAGSNPHRPPTRTKAGAMEARALRRAEIERRCIELSPPISPRLLEHMDSFQASMQIPMPLTDEAWDLLKPKLLSQRQTAERREQENNAAAEALKPTGDKAQDMDDPEKIKERWEIFQKPVRKDLGDYVDQLVHSAWADGRAINAQTASSFAADALVFARNRYATEKPKSMQAGSAFRLVLHNMKWLYDNKIKPLTEAAHGVKDLFRCAGCGEESKTFPFDSLIQHYATNHTDKFGANHVGGVAWYEALWPEDPPFQTSPESEARQKALRTPFPSHQVGTSGTRAEAGPFKQPESEQYAVYQPKPGLHGMPPPTSPGFYTGVSGPFGGYHTPVQQYPSMATSPAFSETPGYPPPSYSAQMSPTSPFDGHGPPFGQHPHTPAPGPRPGTWSTSPGYPPHQPPYAPSPAQNQPSFLQMQMDEVAHISREIWDALLPVKQIPPSVRLYVILQHVVSRFRNRFSNEPNVDLFFQCLGSHTYMQPMKDANGLACRVCVNEKESREEGHSHGVPQPEGGRKLYSFYFLLHHFKNVHVETKLALENAQTHDDPEDQKRLDWKEDMIELPEKLLICRLKELPGMTEASRLNIFKEVFPDLFKDVTPQYSPPFGQTGPVRHGTSWTGHPPASAVAHHTGQEAIDPLLAQGVIKLEPQVPYPGPWSYPTPSVPREDEYDPRRPSVMESGSQELSGYDRGRPFHGRGYHSYQGDRQSFDAQSHYATSPPASETIPNDLLQSLSAPHRSPPYCSDSYAPLPYPHSPPPHPTQYDYFPPPPPQHIGSPPGTRGNRHTYSAPFPRPPLYGQQAEEPVEYYIVRRRGLERTHGPQ